MKKIALIFYLLFSFFSFAQETDFFTKLKYTDLIFYQKEYIFDIRIKGENPENYTGNFKISSNDYEATNCILNSSRHSKDIKRAKELLQKMILISNALYRSLYQYVYYDKEHYTASYIAPNCWKLSFADEETRKRMSVSKDAVCYFIVKLDENGYITQIKSVIEEDRDITVDYTTKELSPQEASALGGKIAEVLMGNNLVSNFTNIKGSISNPNVKKTFVFEIKTKQ